MDFPRSYSLKEIADIIDAQFVGQEHFPVNGTNEIHRVRKGDLVFVDHPKYYDKALSSEASVILINEKVDCPEGKALIISSEPFTDFNKINRHFSKFQYSQASIDPSATIGEGTVIQPNVFIGPEVEIGKDCIIHAGVTINEKTIIGDRVIVQSGTVLGSDAFYYKNRGTHREKLESVGYVQIEDDVEIGANCTIDRGVTDVTRIGKHTKIDNLVQIGHDTLVGERCVFASQVGIAGCSIIEDEVALWGQVGVISGVTIGAGAVAYGQSGISQSVEGGKTYFGSPATEFREQLRRNFALSKLAERK